MRKDQTSRAALVAVVAASLALGAGVFRMSGRASGTGQALPSASLAPMDRSLQEQLRSTSAGKLALTVVAVDASGVRLRGELREPSYEQKPGASSELARGLARPFYFTVSPSGEMGSFSFARELPIEVRSQLKELATSLQLVAPPDHGEAWRTTEQDVSGEYEVAYAVKEGRVHKTKAQLLRTRVPGGLAPLPGEASYSVKSSADFHLDPSGWPSAAASTDSVDMTLGGIRMASRSATSATLVARESHPELVGASCGAPDCEPEAASDAAYAARARASADRNLVDGKTFSQLHGDLSSQDVRARNQTQARLRALFRTDPRAVEEARVALLGGKLGVEEGKRITAALGGADTPEAQRALTSVLRSADVAPLRKMDAAIALGQTKHPTEDTVAALKEAMASQEKVVSSTSALAAGAVVRILNEAQGNSQDIVQMLSEKLAQATSDGERALYLKALGNTGDDRALPAIQPFFTHDSVELRAIAVYSLRFLRGTPAEQFLLEAIEVNVPQIRDAAVHALADRPLAPVFSAALEALSKTEPEESVRITLLNTLQMRLEQPGDEELARAILTWCASSDPSPRVQTFAKEILGEQTRPKFLPSTQPVEKD
jgi:HEAT repeat protein